MDSDVKRVLVAGATGYLGGFVAREFNKRGHFVRALARDHGIVTCPASGPEGGSSRRSPDEWAALFSPSRASPTSSGPFL